CSHQGPDSERPARSVSCGACAKTKSTTHPRGDRTACRAAYQAATWQTQSRSLTRQDVAKLHRGLGGSPDKRTSYWQSARRRSVWLRCGTCGRTAQTHAAASNVIQKTNGNVS